MLLNSVAFFIFFGAVYLLYWSLGARRQNLVLLAASYFFYAWWDWRFLALIVASTVVTYWSAIRIAEAADERRKRFYLGLAIAFGVGTLGVFKYLGFFVESFTTLLSRFGLTAGPLTLRLILPVGISFYTFQALGYSIDVYRKETEPSRKPLDFAVFMAFFPQALAGPISRAKNLLPQIALARRPLLDDFTRGAFLIVLGLVKKTTIADGVSDVVNTVYDSESGYSGLDILLATYAYTIQMYCDFSGYTDIARGVARLLGFRLVKNFMTPFYAASPSEYWTRWHISLSSWVKDYVYLPLALHYLRRGGTINEYKPHVYSMVLMGLWHGAAWTYVLWGIYHGFMLILWDVLRWPKRLKPFSRRIPKAVWIVVYFHVTLFSLLLFRAESVAQVGQFLHSIFFDMRLDVRISRPALPALLGIPVFLVLDFLAFRAKSELFYRHWPPVARAAVYATLLVLLVMGWSNAPTEFIYLRF